jgi:RNA polymerase sigma-70 factor (ECF subfamily)
MTQFTAGAEHAESGVSLTASLPLGLETWALPSIKTNSIVRPFSPDLSDQCLLEHAFEMLVHRYQHALYPFARRYVGSEEAQDVVQLTLLQLYLSLSALHSARELIQRPLSLRAWLYRVARNRCIDASRKNKRASSWQASLDQAMEEESGEMFFALADPAPLPEEQVKQAEDQRELQAAIWALPPQFRRIVWLRCTEELSFEAISQRLHIPLSTAKTSYYRACRRLRKNLILESA